MGNTMSSFRQVLPEGVTDTFDMPLSLEAHESNLAIAAHPAAYTPIHASQSDSAVLAMCSQLDPHNLKHARLQQVCEQQTAGLVRKDAELQAQAESTKALTKERDHFKAASDRLQIEVADLTSSIASLKLSNSSRVNELNAIRSDQSARTAELQNNAGEASENREAELSARIWELEQENAILVEQVVNGDRAQGMAKEIFQHLQELAKESAVAKAKTKADKYNETLRLQVESLAKEVTESDREKTRLKRRFHEAAADNAELTDAVVAAETAKDQALTKVKFLEQKFMKMFRQARKAATLQDKTAKHLRHARRTASMLRAENADVTCENADLSACLREQEAIRVKLAQATAEETEGLKCRIAILDRKVREAGDAHTRFQIALQKAQTDIWTLQAKNAEAEQEKTNLFASLRKLESDGVQLDEHNKANVMRLDQEIAELTRKVDNASDDQARNLITLQEAKEDIWTLGAEKAAIEQEKTTLSAKLHKLERANVQLDEDHKANVDRLEQEAKDVTRKMHHARDDQARFLMALKDARGQIGKPEADNAAIEKEKTDLSDSLRKLERESARRKARVQRRDQRISGLTNELKNAKDTQAETEKELKQSRDECLNLKAANTAAHSELQRLAADLETIKKAKAELHNVYSELSDLVHGAQVAKKAADSEKDRLTNRVQELERDRDRKLAEESARQPAAAPVGGMPGTGHSNTELHHQATARMDLTNPNDGQMMAPQGSTSNAASTAPQVPQVRVNHFHGPGYNVDADTRRTPTTIHHNHHQDVAEPTDEPDNSDLCDWDPAFIETVSRTLHGRDIISLISLETDKGTDYILNCIATLVFEPSTNNLQTWLLNPDRSEDVLEVIHLFNGALGRHSGEGHFFPTGGRIRRTGHE